jgi:HTH-type transcriptional regulator, sugar sensing transcriptional regulator
MNQVERSVEVLRELGLNQLEAEVYAHLLPRPPMTAYRIAQELGRPTANVYKAVEALARAGALLVEEGESRKCRAVAAQEFLRNRERTFVQKSREAEDVLSTLQGDTYDERVYRVEAASEVFRRARSMIERASHIAVVDAFPDALEELRGSLEAAASRGVRVAVEAYAPVALVGCDVTCVPEGELSIEAWRSEQLNLVTDGSELLLALLSSDLTQVHQALWSRSVYLSCILHAGMLSEQTVLKLVWASRDGSADGLLRQLVERHPFFRTTEVPGHRELLARYAATHPPERSE